MNNIQKPADRRQSRSDLIGSRRRRGSNLRRNSPQRWGATAVEFAIVANVLMIMILTCMEFARMNMARNLMQDAAYFGARHAVVPGATADEAIDAADTIMSSMLTNGYTISVSDLDEDATEIDVTVEVDLGAVALFAPYFLPETTISTTANMRTERYGGFYQQ
jgi:Flp pilus assembly protein TadG